MFKAEGRGRKAEGNPSARPSVPSAFSPPPSAMALIGNRFIEHDLRSWLDGRGYYGRSAEVRELELAAVRRPGWVQVFRFRVRAKNQTTGEWEALTGLIRDDERVKKKSDRTEIRLSADDADHAAAFAAWSDGLLTLRTADAGRATAGPAAFAAAALLVGAALIGAALAAARWL